MRLTYLSLMGVLAASGCTGLSLDESTPGGDTWLESGRIGVDPETESSFVMRATQSGWSTKKTLWAVPPEGEPSVVLDATGMNDLRVLFPDAGVLVMGEVEGHDRLKLFDRATLAQVASHDAGVRYHGTRMAPSRQWIAVADNTSAHAPIHVIDPSDFSTRVIPHGGEWLEATWLRTRDALAAIVFYDQFTELAEARLLVWSIADLEASGFATDVEGMWAAPELDVTVPGVSGDFLFSFTWVGVAPNDAQIVFPVLADPGVAGGEWTHRLLVLDPVTQDVRTVEDARGPVGFTPDGATIVSYRYVDGTPSLLLLDAETLDESVLPLPTYDVGPEFFVSHEGNFVVVASPVGGEKLVLYDVDNGIETELAGPGLELLDFASRAGHPEIWLVDAGLYRLDFTTAELESIPLGFVPDHVNYLPTRDLLVLGDAADGDLVFFDPVARVIARRVALR